MFGITTNGYKRSHSTTLVETNEMNTVGFFKIYNPLSIRHRLPVHLCRGR